MCFSTRACYGFTCMKVVALRLSLMYWYITPVWLRMFWIVIVSEVQASKTAATNEFRVTGIAFY